MKSRGIFTVSKFACYCACFLIVFIGIVAFGQAGRGSISGTVSDPNGAVVSGTQVVLLNKATGVTLHTTTSSAGLYNFVSLNPGVYQVTASQTGFANVVQDKILFRRWWGRRTCRYLPTAPAACLRNLRRKRACPF